MKKLTIIADYLFWILIFSMLVNVTVNGQTPGVIRHVYKKDTTVASTVTFSMYATVDTIIIFPDTAAILQLKCGTTPPPAVFKLDRVLYVGSADFTAILAGGAAAQEFKWYLQDYGYTGVSWYGVSGLTSADWPKLRALHKDLRTNYGIKIVEATGGNLTSLISRIAFNNTCLEVLEKFNVYNNEDEYWNAGTDAQVLAAWKVDSASMKPLKMNADAAGIGNLWYHGWPPKNQVAALYMRDKLTLIMYHIYNAGTPNMDYGDWRWKYMNDVSSPAAPTGCAALLSGEGAFSGPWLATHKLEQVDSMLIQKFKQYPNLKLKRVQWFMYSKMKSYQLPKRRVSTGLMRMAAMPKDTTTSPEHLKTAVER